MSITSRLLRFFLAGALCFGALAVLLPLIASAETASPVFRGTVSSIVTCADSAGFYFTVGASTDGYIFKNGTSQSIPRSYALKIGDTISGVASATTTCNSNSLDPRSGRTVVYYGVQVQVPAAPPIATTTPGAGTSGSGSPGSNSGSSFVNQIQNLFNGIFRPPTSQTPTGQSAGGSSSAANAGNFGQVPFGGAIDSPIFRCVSPPAAICIPKLSAPVPIPIICQPGVCQSFLNGPPSHPSQWLLGNAGPVLTPCLDAEGEVICAGFPIGRLPGHGSSGPSTGGQQQTPTQPPKPFQCGECKGDTSTVSGKAEVESCLRGQLEDAGVTVNRKGGCLPGQSYQGNACTDLSGLQCDTLKYIEQLASQCGPFTLTGGSELGHSFGGRTGGQCSHQRGVKIDISLADGDACAEKLGLQAGPRDQYNRPTLLDGNNVWVRESNHWDISLGCGII